MGIELALNLGLEIGTKFAVNLSREEFLLM